MWKVIYNILTYMAFPVLLLYGLTNRKIRKNLWERLSATTQGMGLKDALWVHAASVGEAALAATVIDYMRKNTTVQSFIITTNTYYTKDMLRTKFGTSIPIFALPFDLSYLVKRFVADTRFRALVIIETEIWPNLIWQAAKHHIPVIIANGRISDGTLTAYRKLSPFLRTVLSDVNHVAAQSEEHRKRFISIGLDPDKITTTGNIKYWQKAADEWRETTKDNVITFGSIKEKELDIILPLIISLKTQLKDTLIYIAPRELHLTTTIETELSRHLRVQRFSARKKGAEEACDVVLVDTMGDLLGIYQKSRVAFVGGSLAPYGGQNILEPLFFGTPVVFGPHMGNFRDIADIVLQNKAGVMVSTEKELRSAMENILANPSLQRDMGKAGRTVIQQQQDVMKKTVDVIVKTIGRANRL